MNHYVLVDAQTNDILVIDGKSIYDTKQQAVTSLQNNKCNEVIHPKRFVNVISLWDYNPTK